MIRAGGGAGIKFSTDPPRINDSRHSTGAGNGRADRYVVEAAKRSRSSDRRAQGRACDAHTLAIVLSGDGGWADIDQRVGQRLQARGVDVVGLDMRDYLRKGHHDPASVGFDVSRIARRYVALWGQRDVAIIGYSRGADLAPFAAANLAPDVRQRS